MQGVWGWGRGAARTQQEQEGLPHQLMAPPPLPLSVRRDKAYQLVTLGADGRVLVWIWHKLALPLYG